MILPDYGLRACQRVWLLLVCAVAFCSSAICCPNACAEQAAKSGRNPIIKLIAEAGAPLELHTRGDVHITFTAMPLKRRPYKVVITTSGTVILNNVPEEARIYIEAKGDVIVYFISRSPSIHAVGNSNLRVLRMQPSTPKNVRK